VTVAEVEEVSLGLVCRVPAAEVLTALRAIAASGHGFTMLVDLLGTDTDEDVEITYHLRSLSRDEELYLKTRLPYAGVLESAWEVYPAALMPERETAELFGLRLAGHPNPSAFSRPTASNRSCSGPLRSAASRRCAHGERSPAGGRASGTARRGCPRSADASAGIRRLPAAIDDIATEHLVVNMGPQHPSTHGVLRMLVELDGEEVVNAEASVGYLHRGIEKLAEHRRYNAVGTLMDRGDYVSGIMNELAFALATEKLLEVEIPPKANWIRSLASELNRIASHLVWYGTFGLDAGGMGQFLYGMRDREMILDVLEAISGQRMMFNYVRPGGVLNDLPPGIDGKIRRFLDEFAVHIEEHDQLLGGNEIFQSRVRGLGIIDRELALAFGLTGANLRATGLGYDVRREHEYAAYPELDFDVRWGLRATAGTGMPCGWARCGRPRAWFASSSTGCRRGAHGEGPQSAASARG